tara:strand:- start:88 stop:501 length:414 start_codon:yes stop_codon:yes gene_type:complete
MKQPFSPKQAILAHIETTSLQVVRSLAREFLSIVNRNNYSDTTGASYDAERDLQSFLDTHQYRLNCENIMVRNYKQLIGATDKELMIVVDGILYFLSQNVIYDKMIHKYSFRTQTVERAAEMLAQNTGLLLIESLNQ